MSKATGTGELLLSCVSWQEAQKIVDHLLENKLISHAEFLKADGVQLILHAAETELEQLEAALQSLGNYSTRPLMAK